MKTPTAESRRVTKECRYRRERGISLPALNDNGRPILPSVWLPTAEDLTEYRKVPFYRAIKFTGRTFPFVVRNLLQLYSNPGDTVYDPMLGSGTTLYEATKLGRIARGSDLNPKTVANFRERWLAHCKGMVKPPNRQCNAETLEHVPDESVDLVIMSFPWFASWKFHDKSHPDHEFSMEMNRNIDDFVDQSTRIYSAVRRILKPGGYACNIMGNTYIQGAYFPVSLHLIKAVEAAELRMHYQWWSLRVQARTIATPWARSTLDINARKADNGCGWDMHEDILVVRKDAKLKAKKKNKNAKN